MKMEANSGLNSEPPVQLSDLPEPIGQIFGLRAMQLAILIFMPLVLAKTYSLNVSAPLDSYSWPVIEGKMLSRSIDCWKSHGGDVCHVHVSYEQRGLVSPVFELTAHDVGEIFPFSTVGGYKDSAIYSKANAEKILAELPEPGQPVKVYAKPYPQEVSVLKLNPPFKTVLGVFGWGMFSLLLLAAFEFGIFALRRKYNLPRRKWRDVVETIRDANRGAYGKNKPS